ncbi:MAG: hypothetical protein WD136_01720 [Cyanobium sp.]
MTEPSSSSSALATATPTPPPADISNGVFSGIAAFEAAQRMAQALCTSTMVPAEYRGQQGLSNSLIALEIAARMGLSPLVVMQNMTPIHGKPSWSSSFLIATVNASGRFSPLRFVFDDKDNPSCCCAVARDKATGEVLEGQTISIEMAKKEGWWSRPDRYGKETSKWQSMTGQMLRYRSAAFWVKVYCPEISLGLMTQDEVVDVQTVEVAAVEPVAAVPSLPAPSAPALAIQPSAIPQPISQPLPQITADSAAAPETDHDEKTEASTAADAQGLPAPRRSPRRATAAQKRSDPPAETDHDETPTGLSPEEQPSDGATTAAEAAPTPSSAAHQAKPPAQQAPDPDPTAGTGAEAQPRAPELVTTALQEIPKLDSATALVNARQRVNRLLAEGHLSDDGAERLWTAIDRRLKQLQASSAAAEPQQVS